MMTARVGSVEGARVTLQVEFELGGNMLEMESSIQEAVNAVGTLATGEALARFDTDGAGIGDGWGEMVVEG